MSDILSFLASEINIVQVIKDNLLPVFGIIVAGGAGLSWYLYRLGLKILPSKKFFDWLGDKIALKLVQMAKKSRESAIDTANKVIEACDEIKKDMLYFIERYKNKKN